MPYYPIDHLRKDINDTLEGILSGSSGFPEMKSTSPELAKNLHGFITRKGKRIRPLLFLISYLGYTPRRKMNYPGLLRSAASIELLHDFLLVHDDVIDNSDLRRGKPSLHRVFNKTFRVTAHDRLGYDLSIVAGDILYALAIENFLSVDEDPELKEKALRIFTGSAVLTGIGEYIDVVNNTRNIDKLSHNDIASTYILKTAKYTFEGPMLAGSVLAGVGVKEQERISEMALSLGQAFQIHDDLIDIFSTSGDTGKPMFSDLNESKKTLIAWRTCHSLRGKDRDSFRKVLGKKNKTAADLKRLYNMITGTGAGEFCRGETIALLDKAMDSCLELKINARYKEELVSMIIRLAKKTEKLRIPS
ncbi:MAG: polyprenyl synthetase family protein [Candidatus Omnitrophica bacterium]|nr:polyprenyl synthetase family protein [Candidatus Omnitrophota bacterium]MDD5487669.1 polyprenyl synthetase family protein [Candidatus Omnitrophota bacterium]